MRSKNVIILTAASLVAIIGGSMAGLSMARQVTTDIGGWSSPAALTASRLDADREKRPGSERTATAERTATRPPPVARANLNHDYTPGKIRNGVRILTPYEPARKRERDRLAAEVNWEADYYGPGEDYEFVDAAAADDDGHRFLQREKTAGPTSPAKADPGRAAKGKVGRGKTARVTPVSAQNIKPAPAAATSPPAP